MVNSPLKKKILLVENGADSDRQLKNYLQKQEFEIHSEADEDRAISRILTENPDMVIFNNSRFGLSTLKICDKIRQQYKHPIMVLATKEDENDELKCLELGVDDYVARPSNLSILLARIRMLLRRSQRYSDNNHKINLGSLIIDYGKRMVRKNLQDIDLSTAEFDLLVILAKNVGEPLTRDQISMSLRGYEWNGTDRSVDLTVSRLRKKLGDNGRQPRQIKSVRNIGYMLIPVD